MATDKIEILVEAKVKEAIKGLEDVQKESKNIKKQNAGLLKSLKSNWLAVAAKVTAAVIVIKKAFDFAKEFAKFQQSTEAMEKQFGVSADKVIKKLKEVSAGTISNANIVESANRAMALNVTKDLDKMAELMEVARVRGRAMGIDTTQAFNDIVTGIGRGSPLILDNLGIVTKGWAEEAKASGKAMDTQFILNKVLEDGREILNRSGKMTLSTAERFDVLSANADNARKRLGQALLPVVNSLTDTMTMLANATARVIEKLTEEKDLFKLDRAQAYEETLKKINDANEKGILTDKKLNEQYRILNDATASLIAQREEDILKKAEDRRTDLDYWDKEIAIAEGRIKAIEEEINKRTELTKVKYEELGAPAQLMSLEKLKFEQEKSNINELNNLRLQALQSGLFFEQELTNLTKEEILKRLEDAKMAEEEQKLIEERIAEFKKNIWINSAQFATDIGNAIYDIEKANINANIKDEKERARKIAEIERKQAEFQRVASTFSIIANTAQAIMKAYAELGPILGSIAAGFASAAGIAQLAAVHSAPLPEIPSFAQGGSFITNGPQLMQVGDNASGRERVTVQPLDSSTTNDYTTKTFNFYGIQDLSQARNELLRIEGQGAF